MVFVVVGRFFDNADTELVLTDARYIVSAGGLQIAFCQLCLSHSSGKAGIKRRLWLGKSHRFEREGWIWAPSQRSR